MDARTGTPLVAGTSPPKRDEAAAGSSRDSVAVGPQLPEKSLIDELAKRRADLLTRQVKEPGGLGHRQDEARHFLKRGADFRNCGVLVLRLGCMGVGGDSHDAVITT